VEKAFTFGHPTDMVGTALKFRWRAHGKGNLVLA
jgi:hypothetical protein